MFLPSAPFSFSSDSTFSKWRRSARPHSIASSESSKWPPKTTPLCKRPRPLPSSPGAGESLRRSGCGRVSACARAWMRTRSPGAHFAASSGPGASRFGCLGWGYRRRLARLLGSLRGFEALRITILRWEYAQWTPEWFSLPSLRVECHPSSPPPPSLTLSLTHRLPRTTITSGQGWRHCNLTSRSLRCLLPSTRHSAFAPSPSAADTKQSTPMPSSAASSRRQQQPSPPSPSAKNLHPSTPPASLPYPSSPTISPASTCTNSTPASRPSRHIYLPHLSRHLPPPRQDVPRSCPLPFPRNPRHLPRRISVPHRVTHSVPPSAPHAFQPPVLPPP